MAELKAEKSIVVNAPIEKVWKLMLDIPGWPKWFPALKAAGPVSGAPLAQGSVLSFKLALMGPALTMKVSVIESQPPRRVAWTGGMLGVSAVHSFDFETQGGKTKVISKEAFQGPMVGFLKIFFNDAALGKLHQDWIEALKVAAEK